MRRLTDSKTDSTRALASDEATAPTPNGDVPQLQELLDALGAKREAGVQPLGEAVRQVLDAHLRCQAAQPSTAPLPLLLSIGQAESLTGIHARALKRLVSAGELPDGAVVRVGLRRMFSRVVLEQWVARGCPTAGRSRRGRR